jgi:adenylylsulfate kinase-like enzyme
MIDGVPERTVNLRKVNTEERAARLGQRPPTIWLIGVSPQDKQPEYVI